MNMELLTQKQRERKTRDIRIAAMFMEMRRTYPNATETRIIAEIAEKGGFGIKSSFAVRKALISQKTITPVTR